MAGVFKDMFGGSKSSAPARPDDDFADFVEPPQPSPTSVVADSATAIPAEGTQAPGTVPYTKWYRVWERTSPSDFVQEAFVIPLVLVLLLCHLWGTRKNRRKAREWAQAHGQALQSEFALVGFDSPRTRSADAVSSELVSAETMLKEKSPEEFSSYATGRQNVAFLDVAIKLPKRFNPIIYGMDTIGGFFFDSWAAPTEKVEATVYAFDGREKDLVPVPRDATPPKVGNSAYDGFIWAVVHKASMRQFRQDRYDASITFTRDNPKLPSWVTVMTESAEITDALLSPELIKAIEQAGQDFEYLIVSDQPLDKPQKIEETAPRKRVQLSMTLPSSSSGYASTLPLFNQFLRFPDKLASVAHFRGEVMRKIRNTREEEIKKLRRADEEEKAEERKLAAEKIKKEERERILRGLSADEQRKYLDREREKDQRKSMRKNTRRQ